MPFTWKDLFFEELGGFTDKPEYIDLSSITAQPVGERVYHINNVHNQFGKRKRQQSNWHQVLGRLEDHLFQKSIPMNPIEMVGLCNFDNIVPETGDSFNDSEAKQPESIYLAGPVLRQLVLHDRYHVKRYHNDNNRHMNLELFVVGESPQIREATVNEYLRKMTTKYPYSTEKDSEVICTKISVNVAHITNPRLFDITIEVTESPTIQHLVMTRFDYHNRVWASIKDLEIYSLPSSDYSLKTFSQNDVPIL